MRAIAVLPRPVGSTTIVWPSSALMAIESWYVRDSRVPARMYGWVIQDMGFRVRKSSRFDR